MFPNAIYLVNFEANETMLRKFLEIGIKVIVIMKGDPARCIAVGDVGKCLLCRRNSKHVFIVLHTTSKCMEVAFLWCMCAHARV